MRALIFNLCLVPLGAVYTGFYAFYNHFGVTALGHNFIGNSFTLEAVARGGARAVSAMTAVMLLLKSGKKTFGKFHWRWSILLISIFICVADLSYFMCLSEPGSMVSIASMIRRCSALVAFVYGVVVLHEGDLKLKVIDQCLLIAGVLCMVIGSL
ncbi:MAG: hypothetical protein MJZ63_08970 [Muribaculaceae bacterium]|nr:hypothetical protein [Muribaculaceae bacterium]